MVLHCKQNRLGQKVHLLLNCDVLLGLLIFACALCLYERYGRFCEEIALVLFQINQSVRMSFVLLEGADSLARPLKASVYTLGHYSMTLFVITKNWIALV